MFPLDGIKKLVHSYYWKYGIYKQQHRFATKTKSNEQSHIHIRVRFNSDTCAPYTSKRAELQKAGLIRNVLIYIFV